MKSDSKWVDAGAWLKRVNDSWMYANLAKKIIAEAPRVEAFGHWIPVSERFPENSDRYVLAIVNGKYGNITFHNAIQIADYNKREGWFVDGYEHLGAVNVTHWMPLPDVPRGEGQE